MMRLPRHQTSHPDRRALLIQIVAVQAIQRLQQLSYFDWNAATGKDVMEFVDTFVLIHVIRTHVSALSSPSCKLASETPQKKRPPYGRLSLFPLRGWLFFSP